MDKRALYRAKMKLQRSLRIVLGGIFLFQTVFILEAQTSKARVQKVSEVEVRLLRSADVPKLNKLKGLRAGKVEERLKAGHLCFIGEKNGDIVHYRWICFNEAPVDELERKIRVRPNSAYMYDAYTVPNYRGKGIHPVVLTNAADYLFQSGIKEMYSVIMSNNYSSLRTWQKIGSQKIGEVTFVKLFNSRIYKCKAKTTRDYAKLKEMLSL
jgi:ribosomal protein S18 acetylase RimI-like enzyme